MVMVPSTNLLVTDPEAWCLMSFEFWGYLVLL